MLNHAHPPGFGFALVIHRVFAILEIFIQRFEIHFLVFAFWGVNHRAGVTVYKPAFALRSRAITQHAVHGVVSQRLASVVGYIKAHINGIVVFAEGINLVHFHAIRLRSGQTHFNFV